MEKMGGRVSEDAIRYGREKRICAGVCSMVVQKMRSLNMTRSDECGAAASLHLVAIVELDILLAYAAIERQSCVCGPQPRRARLLVCPVQEKDFV